MKEYTILAILSLLIVFLIEARLKSGIFRRVIFWFFLLIIAGFKFLVNGYLTAEGIVLYNHRFFLGVRIGSIPLEDFIFGFSMVSVTIILWEYFKKEKF
jgi:lycopene cyclase domain-containing protein